MYEPHLSRMESNPTVFQFEERSANTAENASFSAVLLKPKTSERWILVTSAFHMPRAIGAFRKGGFAVEAYPGEYLAIGRASEGRKAVKEIMGWFIIER